jgi:ATP-dependent DNA ligase
MPTAAFLFALDFLALEGTDLRSRPLVEHKAALAMSTSSRTARYRVG